MPSITLEATSPAAKTCLTCGSHKPIHKEAAMAVTLSSKCRANWAGLHTGAPNYRFCRDELARAELDSACKDRDHRDVQSCFDAKRRKGTMDCLARVFPDGHANIRIWINEYNATLA